MSKKKKDVASDSIISSEWEYLDPTPDIHALFIQFNHRFFSGKLEGVEVKWSPRMTLCAGVCSYEGRGGLCSVRLSAPLLKLRPRKDLVETLLHEMIHAFLFVTQSNRDRDGHGPEFQKHMHRINKECGCNITIYHSFHEEVRLYQQHVWRCNGPCQSQKPFYGLLRRATNRAPGPNDPWWSQHQATCNGKYIKIQEPENYKQKKSKASATKENNGGDIRKFVFPGSTNGKPIPGTSGVSNGNLRNPVHTINNVNSSPKINVTGNIRSFSEIGTGSNKPVSQPGTGNVLGRGRGRGMGGGLRGATSNRGGKTLVVNGTKTNKKEESTTTSAEPDYSFVPFQGKGHVLGKPSTTKTSATAGITKPKNPFFAQPSTSKVSVTANGDSGIKSQTNKKNKNSDDVEAPSPKITKWFSPTKKQSASSDVIVIDDAPQVKCPVCSCNMSAEAVNAHLDECLSRLSVQEPTSNVIIIDDDEKEEDNLEKCPLCDAYYPPDKLEAHVNSCVQTLHDAFEADMVLPTEGNTKPSDASACSSNEETVNCPICQIELPSDKINQHLDACLSESVISNGDFS